MAVATSRGRKTSELQIPKKWKDSSEASPERNRVWTEPCKLKNTEKKVPVVYYLSRNGQLEHPHFMEVPLASPEGLFLRDVINRLNLLRGNGMANLYSWSSKRSYKNGFVWHDLSENDFIYPAHGQEYVLKGSEFFVETSHDREVLQSCSSRTLRPPSELQKSSDETDFPAIIRRRNQSWSSIDLHEYKVYKSESATDSTGKAAADASTQTDDSKRRRRRSLREAEERKETEEQKVKKEEYQSQSTELNRDEISPPPSDSSPETLESLMKAAGRLVISTEGAKKEELNRTADNFPSGRMKASTVLMQFLSCGAISFKNCKPTFEKDQGLSLLGHYKARLPRGVGNQTRTSMENLSSSGVKLEDQEYFSGSIIETKKEKFPTLKKSSSYNADRSSHSQLELAEKEIEGARSKCIPRKPKTMPTKNEKGCDTIITSCNSSSSSNNGQGEQ